MPIFSVWGGTSGSSPPDPHLCWCLSLSSTRLHPPFPAGFDPDDAPFTGFAEFEKAVGAVTRSVELEAASKPVGFPQWIKDAKKVSPYSNIIYGSKDHDLNGNSIAHLATEMLVTVCGVWVTAQESISIILPLSSYRPLHQCHHGHHGRYGHHNDDRGDIVGHHHHGGAPTERVAGDAGAGQGGDGHGRQEQLPGQPRGMRYRITNSTGQLSARRNEIQDNKQSRTTKGPME
jgi:hypothetical protein